MTDPADGAPPARSVVVNARGIELIVDPADDRGRAMLESKADVNPHSMTMWREMVAAHPWDLVVDVGCNYGEMLAGVALPPAARVVAFEPSPRIIPILEQNLRTIDPRIELVRSAVADTTGEARFVHLPWWSGQSHLQEGDAPTGAEETYTVSLTTLDEQFLADPPASVAIKVDVEGAEPRVLAGARALLSAVDSYALMAEVMHLDDAVLVDLLAGHEAYAYDRLRRRLRRLSGTGAARVRSLRSTRAYYQQDLVLTGRPLDALERGRWRRRRAA